VRRAPTATARRRLRAAGSVFPLVAKDGGVLMRSAIPKPASISAAWPGCRVGVLSELMNDDGTVTPVPRDRLRRAP